MSKRPLPAVELSAYERAINRLNDLPLELDRVFSEALEELRAQRDKAQANYQFMVDRAANEKLDGYRELGAKCAELERERDEARDEVNRLKARMEAEAKDWPQEAVNEMVEDMIALRKEYVRAAFKRGAEAQREACAIEAAGVSCHGYGMDADEEGTREACVYAVRETPLVTEVEP